MLLLLWMRADHRRLRGHPTPPHPSSPTHPPPPPPRPQDLANYLTGRSSTSDYITIVVPELPDEGLEATAAAKRQRLDEAGAAAPAPAAGPGPLGDLDATAAGAAAPAEAAGAEDAESAALRAVMAHEVQLRDRNSMLSIPGRSFKRVEEMVWQYVHRASREEEQRRRAADRAGTSRAPVIPIKPSGRYERQTAADATLRDIGADKLGVRVGFAAAEGSGAVAPAQQPPPSSKPAAAAQQQLQAARPQQQQTPSSAHQRRPSGSAAAAPGRPPSRAAAAASKRSGTPIIMVPPALTALVGGGWGFHMLARAACQATAAERRSVSCCTAPMHARARGPNLAPLPRHVLPLFITFSPLLFPHFDPG